MFDLSAEEIVYGGRKRKFALARKFIYLFLREEKEFHFTDIGKLFGKDHSTIVHGINSLNEEIQYSRAIMLAYAEFKDLALEIVPNNPIEFDPISGPSRLHGGRKY